MAEDVVRKDGLQFPTKPTVQRYLDIPYGNVSVPHRWLQFKSSNITYDLLWMGKCISCDDVMYTMLDPEHLQVMSNYVTSDHTAASIRDEDEPDVEYRCCLYCSTRRKEEVLRKGRRLKEIGESYAPIVWPDSMFTAIREREAKRREEQAKWLEPRPMAPVHHALVYLKDEGRIVRFDSWVDGKAKIVGVVEPVEADKVFALVPAIFGLLHENLVSIPDDVLKQATRSHGDELLRNGDQAMEVTATGWRYGGHHHMVTCRSKDGRTHTFSADGVAVYVPAANPAAEQSHETIERLEYKAARVEYSMHERLVGEAKARGWCETFDPMLVAQGLEPRSGKRVIKGVAEFEYTIDTKDHDLEEIEKLATDPSGVWNYVPMTMVKASNIQIIAADMNRMLS